MDNSSLSLNAARLTFGGLGSVVAGRTLTVLGSSGDYAFRVLGDMSANADFQALVGKTTVDGVAASYRFDGVYTDVAAVPEPESFALLLAGLGLVVGATYRRRTRV